MTEKRHQWASNLGFILAAAGSAVGLGNIWKFPGKVGAYGGGAFLLCYLLIVFLVGFPVMLAELSIGRATQKNVVGAFRTLNPRWRFAGYIGIVTLFVILSYYCVVGGWVLKYVRSAASAAVWGPTIPAQITCPGRKASSTRARGCFRPDRGALSRLPSPTAGRGSTTQSARAAPSRLSSISTPSSAPSRSSA